MPLVLQATVGGGKTWLLICEMYASGKRQRQRKVLTIGGGTDDGACVSTHTLGGSWGMLPRNIFKTRGMQYIVGEHEGVFSCII